MKNRGGGGGGGGGGFLMKQIMSMVSSLGRAKSLARLLKNKANALRTRLIIFSLLRDKRLMTSSITQKIHSLTSHHRRKEDHDDCHSVDDVSSSSSSIKSPSSIVLYNQNRTMILPINPTVYEEMEEAYSGEKYDKEYTEEEEEAYSGENNDEEYTVEEEKEEDGGEEYPDLTHSLFESDMDPGPGSVIEMVKNEKGEEFKLEDEIDRVADLFIEKFHRQMRLQRQLSIKRYQEMLERSA